MIALEVTRNGKRLCVAGIGEDGVVTATVHWNGRPGRVAHPQLAVGGLYGPTGLHATWVSRAIRVGDAITIRVVDVGAVGEVDSPKEPPAPLRVPSSSRRSKSRRSKKG